MMMAGSGFFKMTVDVCVNQYNAGMMTSTGFLYNYIVSRYKEGWEVCSYDLQDALCEPEGALAIGLKKPMPRTSFASAKKSLMESGLLKYSGRRKRYVIALSIKSSETKQSNRKAPTFQEFREFCNTLTDEYCQELSKMEYRKFLATDYWKMVRSHMMSKAEYQCELCSATGELHVHHKSYCNHGWEHKNLEDLITLCESCHRKIHSKIA